MSRAVVGAGGGDGDGPAGLDVALVVGGDPGGRGGRGGWRGGGRARRRRRRPRVRRARRARLAWASHGSRNRRGCRARGGGRCRTSGRTRRRGRRTGSWAGSPTATMRQKLRSGEVDELGRGPGWRPCRPRRGSRSCPPARATARCSRWRVRNPARVSVGQPASRRSTSAALPEGASPMTGRSCGLQVGDGAGGRCGSCRSRPGRRPGRSCACPAIASAASSLAVSGAGPGRVGVAAGPSAAAGRSWSSTSVGGEPAVGDVLGDRAAVAAGEAVAAPGPAPGSVRAARAAIRSIEPRPARRRGRRRSGGRRVATCRARSAASQVEDSSLDATQGLDGDRRARRPGRRSRDATGQPLAGRARSIGRPTPMRPGRPRSRGAPAASMPWVLPGREASTAARSSRAIVRASGSAPSCSTDQRAMSSSRLASTCAVRCEKWSRTWSGTAASSAWPPVDLGPLDAEPAGELGPEGGVVDPADRALLVLQEPGVERQPLDRSGPGPWPR